MLTKKIGMLNVGLVALGAVLLVSVTMTTDVRAQRQGQDYTPAIWVDPDGCEHWVMDDGWEGYMDNHLNRDGTPVCGRMNTCAVLDSDQFFATNRYDISAAARARLERFFQQEDASSFIVVGHTDSRAGDAYNMALSVNRANSVAVIARRAGVRVADVRGMGERQPRASNRTAAGMQQNRRVEIICVQ